MITIFNLLTYICATAITVFVCAFLTQLCIDQIQESYCKIKNPYYQNYYSRLFSDLKNAFYSDKKIVYIFQQLMERCISDRGLDVWEFRDDVEKKFKEQPND